MISQADVRRFAAEGQKWCSGCKAAFPYADFSRSINSRDRHSGICRQCAAKNSREWAARTKAANLAAMAAEKASA